jgi:alpha-methylacyl-CoA racemase
VPARPDLAAPADARGPLDGIGVLDLSTVGPAARCTRLLADYGAAVVKVGPVPGRGADPIRPPFFAYGGGRGFRRLCVDLKDDDGRDAFLALVARADVVVESFRPGVLDRVGLGFDRLSATNRRIVLCSTTGFGQDGPKATWAGHDIDYLAVGGYLAACEPRADGGPPVAGATIADAAGGGMHAAMAVMAALVGRGADGPGMHLDVSVADGVLWLMSLAVDEHLATGVDVGHGHDVISGRYACYDCYPAADGRWLAVGAIEHRFFANLCGLLGCEQWTGHQFDDDVQDKVRADFRAAFATRPRDEWVARLAGADTCVAPVLTVDEMAEDAQFAARGVFVEAAAGPGGGPQGEPAVPRRFRQVGPVLAGMPGRGVPVDLPAAEATHADELLTAAGLSPARVAELRAKGVVA